MHIDQKVLHDFVKMNREVWKNKTSEKADEGEICCVHGIWSDFGQFIISSDLVAKSVQKQTNLPINSLFFGEDYSLKSINESFGIKTQNIDQIWVPVGRRILLALYSEVLIKIGKKKALCNIRYRRMHIGDLVYDFVLRQKVQEEDSFNMNQLNNNDVKRVFACLITAERSYLYYKKYQPRYVISRGIQGIPGIVSQVLMYMGADFISNDVFGDLLPLITATGNMREKVKVNSILFEFYKRILSDGKDDTDCTDDLFIVKGEDCFESREELAKLIGTDINKKNALILPHCLTDCSRMNTQRRYYIDYQDWFVDTLKTISKIKNVNWIIKEHPHALAYNQEKYIKKLFEEYKEKNPNIYWLDKTVSGKSVSGIADVVITDAGDAGCEYVAMGVPTVTCQDTGYARMGVSNNAKTKGEYHRMLKNIDTIDTPDNSEIRIARRIMNIIKSSYNASRSEDPVLKLCAEQERMQSENLKKSSNFSTNNTVFLRKLNILLEKSDIEHCYFANYSIMEMRI